MGAAAYLERERLAETKSEYINGCIYAMAGASRQHVRICVNATIALGSQLRGQPCEPFAQDLRVRVSETGLYTYPDILVACGPEFEDDQFDALLNPVVIVEVLSTTTEVYDRGAKFAHYRHLASLTDYVLIAQETTRIEHFQRQPDDSWLLRVAEAPDDAVELSSTGCRLVVRDVYERVTFDTPAPREPHSGAPNGVA